MVNDLTAAKIQGVFLTPAPSGRYDVAGGPYAPSRTLPFHPTPEYRIFGRIQYNSRVGAGYRASQHKSGREPPPELGP